MKGWLEAAARGIGSADASRTTPARSAPGLLARLRRDVAGNTLAIMCAAMIPLIGFTGSAVDMARLYVVKVRLQQACDAGALAGRHAMTGSESTMPANTTSAPLDASTAAATQAQQFFANNFQNGWFQVSNAKFTPTKVIEGSSAVANAVHGEATVSVPMALMSFFGVQPVALKATCQALNDLADADIMFVLDTTGSMSCWPSDPDNCVNGSATPYNHVDGSPGYYQPEKGQTTDSNGKPMYSKIESLRQAVLLFDQTMRNSKHDPNTHIRYGFVPYSSAVNMKSAFAATPALPASYIQNTRWTYQTRQNTGDYTTGKAYKLANGTSVTGSTSVTQTGITKTNCVDGRAPAAGYARTGATWGDSTYYMAVNYTGSTWTTANGGTCTRTQSPQRAMWNYAPYSLDISQYAAGASVLDPSRIDGLRSTWRGCVEDLNTSASTSFDITKLPHDLNPDFKPSDPAEMWRPMWPDAVWLRNSTTPATYRDEDIAENTFPDFNHFQYLNYRNGGILQTSAEQYACEAPAMRLAEYAQASDVQKYLYGTDFKAFGTTYHDIGMVWGTRMLSPNGVFGQDTAAWTGHNPPSRSIVFITDGVMEPFQTAYTQYGVEFLDQRVDGSGANQTTDTANHIARFRAECDAAKARGITIYVVALGTSLSSDLSYCASPGQAFPPATTTDQLTAAFATIAQRVARLRISQ